MKGLTIMFGVVLVACGGESNVNLGAGGAASPSGVGGDGGQVGGDGGMGAAPGGGDAGGNGGMGGAGGDVGPTAPTVPPAALAACPAADAWETICMSGRYLESFYLLNPDTGDQCSLSVNPGEWLATSMAVLGDDVYGCPNGSAMRFSLETGLMESIGLPCHSMFNWNGVVVRHDDALTHYADSDAVVNQTGTPLPQVVPWWLLTTIGDTLHGAMVQPQQIHNVHLVTGDTEPSVPITTDSMKFGLAGVAGQGFYLLGFEEITHFGPDGTELGEVMLPNGNFSALMCWSHAGAGDR